MRNTCVSIPVVLFLMVFLSAAPPAGKVTGDVIREMAANGSVWAFFVSAQEAVEMDNGNIQPVKGMVSTYRLNDPGVYWMADIVCVSVVDEANAFFAAVIRTSTFDPFPAGSFQTFWVVDAGEPGVWADSLWTRGPVWDESVAEAICSDPWNNLPNREWYVVDGNLQVHYFE